MQPVFVQADDKNITTAYQFSLTPEDKGWEKLSTTEEMVKAYQIPEDILKSMTTEAIVETIIDNPFLIQYMAYDTTEDALDMHFEVFNVYNELYSRDDVLQVLNEVYENESVVTNAKTASTKFFRLTNLELLISTELYLNDQTNFLTANLGKNTNKTMQIHQEKSGERYDAGIYSDYSDGFTWFEENLKNKNSHSDLAKIAERSSTSTYVKTPKGTKVSAIIYDDMTAAEKKEKNDLYASLYPAAKRIYTATKKFNCHSYAWYSQKYSTNKYWIRDPKAYREDGSYTVSKIAANRKVWYTNGTHSAIVSYYNNGTTLYTSKWGSYGLYSHAPTYGPPFGYKQGVKYYK